MNITIFGTGYVGLVTGASLANLGHTVLGVDIDEAKICDLNKGEIPFYEPGLKELVSKNCEKNRLSFSTNVQEGIQFGEALFNCVGTPSKQNGAADLGAVFSIAAEVAKCAQGYKVLINKSTVPPGTARKCQQLIRETNPQLEIDLVSNPEFLKQGNAVYDFNHPDKIVVGATSKKALEVLKRVYSGLLKTYIPFLEMDWETAEMTKYANNAFLATKISFINEIANICQVVGADVKEVAKAMGMDQRIGPKFLNAGIGYGGSCFSKDVQALISSIQEKGYTAKLLQEVDALNERQKKQFVPFLLQKLREVQGDTVTIWGVSFKPKTSDLRGAPSLLLIQELLAQGMTVKVYDPVAAEEARKIFDSRVHYCSSLEDSVSGSNLIILVTEWDEFRNINFNSLGPLMKSKMLFDGRNIYDPVIVHQEGFQYFGVGRGRNGSS